METQPNSGGTEPRILTATIQLGNDACLNFHDAIRVLGDACRNLQQRAPRDEWEAIDRYAIATGPHTFIVRDDNGNRVGAITCKTEAGLNREHSQEWECPTCFHIYRTDRHKVGACPFCEKKKKYRTVQP